MSRAARPLSESRAEKIVREVPAPVQPLSPRPRLALGLLAAFILWLGVLVALYVLTVRHH